MKARIVKNKDSIKLLFKDGSISNFGIDHLIHFFLYFKNPDVFHGDDGDWREFYNDMSEYPGKTLAYITDRDDLLLQDQDLINMIISYPSASDIRYLTTAEYAQKHNRSRELIKTLARSGRIPGAIKKGRSWLFPENAPYPIEPASRKPAAGRKQADFNK